MIYDIRHVTTYKYEAPVAFARCTLRLSPRDGQGQKVFDSGVDVTPPPSESTIRSDFFGNRVETLSVEKSHRELRIVALSRVEVDRASPPLAALTPAWEQVKLAAAGSQSLAPDAPAHYLFRSRLVPILESITAYTRKSFAAGRPILEAADDLMRRIRHEFKYDPDATAVSTPVGEAFERRGGVCQDFAHIMVSGLRGIGIPAAYVSGYIRTIPPPGTLRTRGFLSGAATSSAGLILILPTPCMSATITSCWRSAATMRTFRPSTG